MEMRKLVLLALPALLVSSITTGRGRAQDAELSLLARVAGIAQTAAVDSELAYAVEVNGFPPDQIWNYTTTTTDQGWSSALHGTFNGQPLQVIFQGDLTAFPTVTWASFGVIGSDQWTGAGVLEFHIQGHQFSVEMNSQVTIGNNTGTYNNVMVLGDITDRHYRTFPDLETGTATSNGMPVGLFGFEWDFEDRALTDKVTITIFGRKITLIKSSIMILPLSSSSYTGMGTIATQ